ncbi:MAG TPA: pantetheine-phosphate adenylyltransferase [Saprospiraceae bacterium]|jgi:pantetheine-phosphate adenylyltransferase|nr:pantetheine-phosphate adenylyltransferase [Candidatus Parvibacillus calidus]MBX2936729.1 pantetheine-phosphate adenylyltransferase [Saprospiraceae bacterium]MBX7178478.1 pantetheine-phosphate adenylyltransferase [Saprospiraceae bacterium]MCB0589980.1 pantetheine-phosphate adenylyltransferase [Saprospiraceae bacterium]MCO5282782.1 pantetheine-phosphate adenylyltransferase [Saprospiraceae bacterium]
MKIAVFPGSFDPITVGHFDLIVRSLALFDKVIVAIGINDAKSYLYPLEKRMEWLRIVFAEYDKVEVDHYRGLTADFCKKVKANFLVRGLRNSSDFDYEKTISQVNYIITGGIETIFLISAPKYSHISSTIVREVIKGGGDVKPFLPKGVVL